SDLTLRLALMLASVSSMLFPYLSPARRSGQINSLKQDYPSSETTLSLRSARQSPTEYWRNSSRIAVWSWTALTNSTWAETWTSKTCWSVTGWSPSASLRPRPSHLTCSTTWVLATFTLARLTTSNGWMTASGHTCD